MVQIVFVEPPPPNSGNPLHPWADIAAQLRARPGEWAKCLTGLKSTPAAGIKRGQYIAFRPAGAFDARCVGVKDSEGNLTYELYARFIGEDHSE